MKIMFAHMNVMILCIYIISDANLPFVGDFMGICDVVGVVVGTVVESIR